MKRSPALAGLSRDHHRALDAALRLTRAEADTLPEAVKHFREFFAAHGDRHFQIEESVLVPALPPEDSEWTALCDRMAAEHAELRGLARDIQDVDAARALGERLRDHVRFEERELFEVL